MSSPSCRSRSCTSMATWRGSNIPVPAAPAPRGGTRAGRSPGSAGDDPPGSACRPAPPRLGSGLGRRAWKAGCEIRLQQVLRELPSAAFLRGQLIHAWFEQIVWLDDGAPDEATLRDVAHDVLAGGDVRFESGRTDPPVPRDAGPAGGRRCAQPPPLRRSAPPGAGPVRAPGPRPSTRWCRVSRTNAGLPSRMASSC